MLQVHLNFFAAVMLDMEMLKDVVLDHRLPVAAMLSETAMAGAMTPGGGAATPYVEGGKTPMVQGIGYEDAPWSPIQQGSDDYTGGATSYAGYGQTPLSSGLSPGCALTRFLKFLLILYF
jgi:DNA-directed RNA polymerase II subunit RPB1